MADDFADGIRSSIWHEVATGTGITLAEQNGRLEIEFAADGVPGGEFNVLGAHYGTSCRFPEDFDVRVDYKLLEWPEANGVFVQLNAWFSRAPHLAAVRQSQNWGEAYSSFFGGRAFSRGTADTSGSLRIKRVRKQFTTYVLERGRWARLDSVVAEGAPMISIQAMTSDQWFGHRGVKVAFDNFEIRAVRPAC